MPARATIAELVAELLGTLLFVAIGAGALLVDAYTGGAIGPVGVALAHGLTLAVLVTAFAPLGGGQLNPAVTVALWLVGKMRTRYGLRLIAAQLIGAAAAGFALKFAFNGFDPGDTLYSIGAGGAPMLAYGFSTEIAVGIEATLTALLVFAALLATVDRRAPKMGGFFVGLAYAAATLVGGPLTGGAMNPARWYGTALAYGDLSAALVYVAGPLIGATVAALLVRYLFSER